MFDSASVQGAVMRSQAQEVTSCNRGTLVRPGYTGALGTPTRRAVHVRGIVAPPDCRRCKLIPEGTGSKARYHGHRVGCGRGPGVGVGVGVGCGRGPGEGTGCGHERGVVVELSVAVDLRMALGLDGLGCGRGELHVTVA